MLRFGWLSQRASPPARWDLRHLGWDLIDVGCGAASATPDALVCAGLDHWPMAVVLLDWRSDSTFTGWRRCAQPSELVAVGVDAANDRVEFLRDGFGDALPSQVALVELAERLLSVAQRSRHLPRHRPAGRATLDLFHRDARIADRWVGLHPREFALLWRLAEAEGERLSRADLLEDVWRVGHGTETNSLEVHVSRLRAKLNVFGCAWLIETDPRGGYRLAEEAASQPVDRAASQAVKEASGEAAAVPLSRASIAESGLIETPAEPAAKERENERYPHE